MNGNKSYPPPQAIRRTWMVNRVHGLPAVAAPSFFPSASRAALEIKGWWRRGDIRAAKPKKSFECWVKTKADVPTAAKKTLMEALMAPQQNAGKDEYIVDLEGNEKLY